jgi:hypothetical protein
VKNLCLSVCMVLFAAGSAFAQPPGLRGDPEVGKMLWNFNVLVRPNTWSDVGNSCNGARIFFTEDAGAGGVMGQLTWFLDPAAQQNFEIVDCNGTDGGASVRIDENLGNTIVAIRVLGRKTSQLKFTCEVVSNPNVPEGEDLCVIDTVNLSKNKSFTKVLKNIAEGEFEQVLWTFDPTGTWKIFQVRVLEYNPQ